MRRRVIVCNRFIPFSRGCGVCCWRVFFAKFIEKIVWCLLIQFQHGPTSSSGNNICISGFNLEAFSTLEPFNNPLKLFKISYKTTIGHRPILFFCRHFSVITWCYINPTWCAERTHLFQPGRNRQIILSVFMDYLLFPTDLIENSFRSGRIRSVSSDCCGYIKKFYDQADCSAVVLIINGILGSM